MSLNAEKAFDWVSWEFFYSVLGTFEFHQNFIKTIKALYNKQVKIKGEVSNSSGLERGTGRGGPLSQGITQDNNNTALR